MENGTEIDGNVLVPLNQLNYTFTEEGQYKLSVRAKGFEGTIDFNYYISNDVAGFTLSEKLPKQVYQKGILSIPTATVTKNGEAKTASLLICAPSGAKYSAEDFTYLTETGVYTLTYSAEFAGKKYIREYKVSSIRTDDCFVGDGITETLNVTFNAYDGITGVELKPAVEKKTVTATFCQTVDLNNFSDQNC